MVSYKVFFLLFISCDVFYELYPFHQSEAARVPPATTTGSQGKGGISSRTIVAIVVLISVAVLIFIVAICCLSKRIRKKRDSAPEENYLIMHMHLLGCVAASDISTVVQYVFSTLEAATNRSSRNNVDWSRRIGRCYKLSSLCFVLVFTCMLLLTLCLKFRGRLRMDKALL